MIEVIVLHPIRAETAWLIERLSEHDEGTLF
jgi:hypothetical protein